MIPGVVAATGRRRAASRSYLTTGATAARVSATHTLTAGAAEDITRVGDTYWLLYTSGSPTRLSIASSASPDGPWTPYSGNPILTSGSLAWESTYTNGGSIIAHGGTFYLFYCDDLAGGAVSVATAAAITGPYTKHGSILVDVGAAGAWDSLRVQEPHVIIGPDGTWIMAYMAETTDYQQGRSEKCGIATATNPLGPWTKSPNNPVLPFGAPGSWDQGGTADPSIYYENGVYWMLYSGLSLNGGTPWALGLAYATDVDGPWTRIPGNPILSGTGGGDWDAGSVWRGSIYYENGVYHMPYGGFGGSLGTNSGAAIIEPGTAP